MSVGEGDQGQGEGAAFVQHLPSTHRYYRITDLTACKPFAGLQRQLDVIGHRLFVTHGKLKSPE